MIAFPFAADAGQSPLGFLMPLLIVGAIFYFLVYQPGKKDEAAKRELVAGLQRGDRVVTNAGIHGTMHEAKGETLVLELSPGAFMTVDRDSVKGKIVAEPAAPAKKA